MFIPTLWVIVVTFGRMMLNALTLRYTHTTDLKKL